MNKPLTPEQLELARIAQQFGTLLRQASTLTPPLVWTEPRLDVRTSGRERSSKPN